MSNDFNSIINRNQTGALKTNPDFIQKYLQLPTFDDTLYLWVADMDFPCAPQIINRLNQRITNPIFGYTELTPEYFASIQHWYQTLYNLQLDPKTIIYNNGTVMAIKQTIAAFTNEGDKIIIQSPVYSHFADEILTANRVVSDNKLLCDASNHYTIDFMDFEERCKTAKLFIFCNPHNPTGNNWSHEDIKKLLSIANKHGVLVFSDEVHSDLLRKGKNFTSALHLSHTIEANKLIVATAINKTFNLAGLQGTNLIILDKRLQEKFKKTAGEILITPFTLEATIAAYTQCEGWLEELKTTLDDNLNYMHDFIKAKLPKIKFNIPDATYLTWLDFRKTGLTEREVLHRLANEAHIITQGGSGFGKSGDGFIRMNIACPKSILIEALERIAKLDW